jgi:hypothetical protein
MATELVAIWYTETAAPLQDWSATRLLASARGCPYPAYQRKPYHLSGSDGVVLIRLLWREARYLDCIRALRATQMESQKGVQTGRYEVRPIC